MPTHFAVERQNFKRLLEVAAISRRHRAGQCIHVPAAYIEVGVDPVQAGLELLCHFDCLAHVGVELLGQPIVAHAVQQSVAHLLHLAALSQGHLHITFRYTPQHVLDTASCTRGVAEQGLGGKEIGMSRKTRPMPQHT